MASPSGGSDEVRGSKDYIYFLRNKLGSGATSNVYKGRNKRTGKLVAVKVLRPTRKVENRHWSQELKALRELKHENIILLLDEQDETNTNAKLLVFEWCLGGSLHSILEEPQNKYGLPEAEFLIVMLHLTRAVNYLEEKRTIHQDIKPGNILLFIDSAQRHIYKLSDFGTLLMKKDWQDSQLWSDGTFEYLHPYVFKKALLKQSVDEPFDSYVDMWSTGCTFVHCIIGKLPFRPCHGRADIRSMERMVVNKRREVIYCTQDEQTKEITAHTELPATCNFSQHLQRMLLPILRGLLEPMPSKCLRHEELREKVTRITDMHPVTVLFVTSATYHIVYVEHKANLILLKETIQTVMEVQVNEQILWYGNDELDKFSVNSVKTSTETPVMLVRTSNALWTPTTRPAETMDLPRPPPAVNPPASFQLGRDVAGFVHRGAVTVKASHDMHDCYMILCEGMHRRYGEKLRILLEPERRELDSAKDQVILMIRSMDILIKSSILNHLPKYQKELEPLRLSLTRAEDSLKQLMKKHDELANSVEKPPLNKAAELSFSAKLTVLKCRNNPACCCEGKVAEILRCVMNIYSDFKRDKTEGVHGYNQKQIHKLKRNQLCEWMMEHSDILASCASQTEKLYVASRSIIIALLERKWKYEVAQASLKDLAKKYRHFKDKVTEKQTNMAGHLEKLHQYVVGKDSGICTGLSSYASNSSSADVSSQQSNSTLTTLDSTTKPQKTDSDEDMAKIIVDVRSEVAKIANLHDLTLKTTKHNVQKLRDFMQGESHGFIGSDTNSFGGDSRDSMSGWPTSHAATSDTYDFSFPTYPSDSTFTL